MTEGLVSIITPVYNASRFLEATVRSVQAQSYPQWEMWLIDDASTDGSAQLADQLAQADARIHVLRTPHNSGAAAARNMGIHAAGGQYIAFLDADDQWYPEKLEKQVAFMQETGCALSYTSYAVMDASGVPTGKTISCPPTLTYRQLLMENRIGCLTAMMDVRQTGKMEMPLIHKRQDYGLWLNILKQGYTAKGIQTPLAIYRKYAESLSGNKWKTISYNWTLLRKHQGLSLVAALWYFTLFLLNKTVMAVFRRLFKRG